jgi:hypothetical protein
MWMGLLSMSSSCVSVVSAPGGEVEGEAGRLTGTGTGGVLLSRSC